MKLAVIGKDVSKSISPQIHGFIAENSGRELTYQKISVREEEFDKKIAEILTAFDGLNVTIPYKLKIIPYLNSLSGDAAIFKAVNTVNCRTLTGYNTDGSGFMLMLENGGISVRNERALLLGAGGAGRSVAKKLSDGGAEVFVYDKNLSNAKKIEDEFSGVTALKQAEPVDYDIIINATGVGMHNTEGLSPVGGELLSRCGAAVDLIYVPAESKFLQLAKSFGKKTVNGLGMLFYQAYFAQCAFFGAEPSKEEAKELFIKYQKENL